MCNNPMPYVLCPMPSFFVTFYGLPIVLSLSHEPFALFSLSDMPFALNLIYEPLTLDLVYINCLYCSLSFVELYRYSALS